MRSTRRKPACPPCQGGWARALGGRAVRHSSPTVTRIARGGKKERRLFASRGGPRRRRGLTTAVRRCRSTRLVPPQWSPPDFPSARLQGRIPRRYPWPNCSSARFPKQPLRFLEAHDACRISTGRGHFMGVNDRQPRFGNRGMDDWRCAFQHCQDVGFVIQFQSNRTEYCSGWER